MSELEKAVAELRAGDVSPGRRNGLIRKGGRLDAMALHEAVRAAVPFARGVDAPLLAFQSGVWVDGTDVLTAVCYDLLGSDFLPAHVVNAQATISTSPTLDRIPDVPPAELSALINFRNGMLDWRTGELLPHDPALHSTNQLPHDWDSAPSEPERFLAFLTESVGADPAMHLLAVEAIAYALYVGLPIKKAFMLTGPTDSGKSRFLGLIGDIVGDENASAVSMRQMAADRFVAAELRGVLVNVVADMASGNVSDASLFKMATGDDQIRGERKYGHGFTFRSRAVHYFSVNEIPTSSDASSAYLNRWEIIEFPNTVPTNRQDKHLRATLAADIPGILRLAIDALPALIDRGRFTDSPAAQEMRRSAAEKMDPVRAFVTELVEPNAPKRLARTAVYQAYHNWAKDSGVTHPLTARTFNARLTEAFNAVYGAEISYVRTNGVKSWVGLTLLDAAEPSTFDSWKNRRPEETPL